MIFCFLYVVIIGGVFYFLIGRLWVEIVRIKIELNVFKVKVRRVNVIL